MPKIYGIENHLLDHIKKYNVIGCFIEDFIDQARQFLMNDEKRTVLWEIGSTVQLIIREWKVYH